MSKCVVVNLYKESYDVYIGRAGKGRDGYFGNPIPLVKGKRDECIEAYREYFYGRMKTDEVFRDRVMGLRGKRLGCFCAPQKCHGDVIAEYVNNLFGVG